MALKTKAAIKTQLDAVAAALTLAFADDTTPATIAAPLRQPFHPIRRYFKLFDVAANGTVTVNVAKWNAIMSASNVPLNTAQGSGTLATKVLS